MGGAIGQGACAAVRRGNRMYVIADDLPFLHFLSDSQVRELKWLLHTNPHLMCGLQVHMYMYHVCFKLKLDDDDDDNSLFRMRVMVMIGCTQSLRTLLDHKTC